MRPIGLIESSHARLGIVRAIASPPLPRIGARQVRPPLAMEDERIASAYSVRAPASAAVVTANVVSMLYEIRAARYWTLRLPVQRL